MHNEELENDGQRLLQLAGKSGKFQKVFCIFILLYCFVMFYNITVLPLQKMRPIAHCKITDNDGVSNYVLCTEETYCNPQIEKKIIKEENINNWTLYFEVNCEQEKDFDLFLSAMFLGGFLSNFLMSPLADKYGRKIVLEWEIFGLVSVIIFALFSSNLNVIFVLWSFYESFKNVFFILMIYATETMSQEYFSYLCSLSNVCFPLTGLVVSFLFYSFKDWWTLHLIFTVLAICCGLVFRLMIIESPLFCLERRNIKEFLISVRKIADVNSTDGLMKKQMDEFEVKWISEHSNQRINKLKYLNSSSDALLHVTQNVEDKASIWDYFKKDTTFRKEFILVVYTFAVVKVIFYGVLLNIEKYDQNVFLTSTVLYTSEVIAEFLSGIFSQKYGRILIIKYSFYLAGVSYLLFQFTLENFLFRTFFCFCGNYGLSSSFNVLIIYMTEVFDVTIRSSASSYSRIPADLLVIFSPYFMSKLSLPFVYFSFLCLTSGYLIEFCHETLKRETIGK